MNENDDIIADLTDSFGKATFEKLYIGLREKENRLYTDGQVKQLPFIKSSHTHYTEWVTRQRSTTRLLNYLRKNRKQAAILETGCGNGWLCARLGELSGATVTGIDINESELTQAKRVFQTRTNIQFLAGDIGDMAFEKSFDIIVFAASIQYFPFLNQTLEKAFSIMNPGGEIHILDSPFYAGSEIEDAQRRTSNYYRSIGYGGMIPYYFHHSIESIENYEYKILFDPNWILNKVPWRKDPFPWICIKAS